MGLIMTASTARPVGHGMWIFDMPPHQVRLFGSSPQATGERSVILLRKCSFDAERDTLQFDFDDAIALNVGTLAVAIAIAAEAPPSDKKQPDNARADRQEITFGSGDRQFLDMAKRELPTAMQRAAKLLLEGVRRRSPGDLKRGKSRNFSDTPDNFWYVIVQPRVQELSITVRGSVSHFQPVAKLPIKDDRGNTLFKVASEEDVPNALELIFHAKRRK